MNKQPLLSLCIPTNGVVEWILPVLESIYSQKYDNEKFEVVITDNGKDSHLSEHIAKMTYPNLRYRQTKDEGFLNLVSSLKDGKGMFCKMINHRSLLMPGSIEKMVGLLDKYKETQPIIYFSSGQCKMECETKECPNTDVFVRTLSYLCSWSAGIGFWQKDIPNLQNVDLNEMFPNASLLFDVRENPQYVIWNYKYQKMQDDSGKGGYDLFRTFGVIFLDILNDLRVRDRITNETFKYVKKDLYSFLCDLYYHEVLLPSKHSFIIKDISKSMNVYYGPIYYWRMVLMARLHKMNLRRFVPFSKKH